MLFFTLANLPVERCTKIDEVFPQHLNEAKQQKFHVAVSRSAVLLWGLLALVYNRQIDRATTVATGRTPCMQCCLFVFTQTKLKLVTL